MVDPTLSDEKKVKVLTIALLVASLLCMFFAIDSGIQRQRIKRSLQVLDHIDAEADNA